MSTDQPRKFPMSLLSQLRFPQLFLILAALFVVDLFVPDLVPFIDELVLGVLTLMTGMLKKRDEPQTSGAQPMVQKPAEKNITPTADSDL